MTYIVLLGQAASSYGTRRLYSLGLLQDCDGDVRFGEIASSCARVVQLPLAVIWFRDEGLGCLNTYVPTHARFQLWPLGMDAPVSTLSRSEKWRPNMPLLTKTQTNLLKGLSLQISATLGEVHLLVSRIASTASTAATRGTKRLELVETKTP